MTIVLDILVTLIVAFWMLKDGEELRAGLVNLLPGRVRTEANFALDAFGVVVGGYIRGQLVMALIVGTLAGVGCFVVGVPFPIVVAIAAASFELIPLVGAFIGGATAILLALTKNPLTALWALLLFIAIHIVEGYLLAPASRPGSSGCTRSSPFWRCSPASRSGASWGRSSPSLSPA